MKRILFVCTLLSVWTACHQETREERFAREARELTKQCPIAVDTNTYLDSLVYDKTNSSYQYYYSLHGADDEQLTDLVTHPSFIGKIKSNVVNSVDMKPYKDAGMVFIYHYYSKASQSLLGNIKITPEDYNQ